MPDAAREYEYYLTRGGRTHRRLVRYCKCGCGRRVEGQRVYARDCPFWLANGPRLRAAMLDRDALALDAGELVGREGEG